MALKHFIPEEKQTKPMPVKRVLEQSKKIEAQKTHLNTKQNSPE